MRASLKSSRSVASAWRRSISSCRKSCFIPLSSPAPMYAPAPCSPLSWLSLSSALLAVTSLSLVSGALEVLSCSTEAAVSWVVASEACGSLVVSGSLEVLSCSTEAALSWVVASASCGSLVVSGALEVLSSSTGAAVSWVVGSASCGSLVVSGALEVLSCSTGAAVSWVEPQRPVAPW